jgi:hydroxymethylpyrimidine pyrophosphatase-like HAD family hydrolase|tara:strand:+ start:1014 stop:1316 length:303 start_codon:yes stop_codon:yes gene_type:complete
MEKLIIYVDIDETICFYEGKRHYPNAIPNKENINKINKLYNKGHEITYWTARGSVTQIDWMETTVNQLKKWGCKYHKISVGEKPHYDLLICDKTKRIEEI